MGDKHSSTIDLEKSGNHTVYAVWSSDQDLELDSDESIEEVISSPEATYQEWDIHVVDEPSTIDDIIEIIDYIGRIGTVVWASKKLIKVLRQSEIPDREGNKDEEGENEEDEYIQDIITNY